MEELETIDRTMLSPVPTEPPAPKQLTEGELRKLRKQYWTRELPTVNGCGHKIDPDNPPRSSCQICWFSYFNSQGERVQLYSTWMLPEDKGGIKGGEEALINEHGTKYIHNLKKFLSTIAQWKNKTEGVQNAK